MLLKLSKPHSIIYRKLAIVILLVSFLGTSLGVGYARASVPGSALSYMPAPASLVSLSPEYTPAQLLGIKFYPSDPLKFDFIINRGDSNLASDELKSESTKLINYFLAALTIPEDELWVNLSPYESQRIVADSLGQTDLGKDLLSQDYVLKQLSASVTYPESEIGKNFWKKVYAQASKLFGTNNLPFDTFNKIWIIPNKAQIYEDSDKAIIGESSLKVMMEADYVAMEKSVKTVRPVEPVAGLKSPNRPNGPNGQNGLNGLNELTSQVMKEVVVPLIEQDVNHGKNFSQLRQVCSAVILAAWFKRRLRQIVESVESVEPVAGLKSSNGLNRPNGLNVFSRYFDKNKTKGIETSDPAIKQKIYSQYLEAYKKGVYDYIKKDLDRSTKKPVRRRYFSGGASMARFFDYQATVACSPLDSSSPIKNNEATVVTARLGIMNAESESMVSSQASLGTIIPQTIGERRSKKEERWKGKGERTKGERPSFRWDERQRLVNVEGRRKKHVAEENAEYDKQKGSLVIASLFRSITLTRNRFALTDAEIGAMVHYDLKAIKLDGWCDGPVLTGNVTSSAVTKWVIGGSIIAGIIGGGILGHYLGGHAVQMILAGEPLRDLKALGNIMSESSEAFWQRQWNEFVQELDITGAFWGGLFTPPLVYFSWRLFLPISYFSERIGSDYDAARKLAKIGKRAVPIFTKKLTHKNSDVRKAAYDALDEMRSLTKELKIKRYLRDLEDYNPRIRRDACNALGKIGDKSTEAAVYRAFTNTDPETVYKAIIAINGKKRKFVEEVRAELEAQEGFFDSLPEALRLKESGFDFRFIKSIHVDDGMREEPTFYQTEWGQVTDGTVKVPAGHYTKAYFIKIAPGRNKSNSSPLSAAASPAGRASSAAGKKKAVSGSPAVRYGDPRDIIKDFPVPDWFLLDSAGNPTSGSILQMWPSRYADPKAANWEGHVNRRALVKAAAEAKATAILLSPVSMSAHWDKRKSQANVAKYAGDVDVAIAQYKTTGSFGDFEFIVDDSAYASISPWIINRGYHDIAEVEGEGDDLVAKYEYWERTDRDRLAKNFIKPMRTLADGRVNKGADALVLRILRDGWPGYLKFILKRFPQYRVSDLLQSSNEQIRALPIYKKLMNLVLFEQYWLHKFIRDLVDDARAHNVRALIDYPVAPSIVGVDSVHNPGVLVDNGRANPGVGDKKWDPLAIYSDYDYVRREIVAYLEYFGFSGMRGDALWQVRDKPGYWDSLTGEFKKHDWLMMPELLGSPEIHKLYRDALQRGWMPIITNWGAKWGEGGDGTIASRHILIDGEGGPRALDNHQWPPDGTGRRNDQDRYLMMMASHDWRNAAKILGLLDYRVPPAVACRIGMWFAGTTSAAYSPGPGWEQGDGRDFNRAPGEEVLWAYAPRDTGVDLVPELAIINNLRMRFPFMLNPRNSDIKVLGEHGRGVALQVERYSPDGKRAMVFVENFSGYPAQGHFWINHKHFNIDITKPFDLVDLSRAVDQKDCPRYTFTPGTDTVKVDGDYVGLYFSLEPAQVHAFYLDPAADYSVSSSSPVAKSKGGGDRGVKKEGGRKKVSVSGPVNIGADEAVWEFSDKNKTDTFVMPSGKTLVVRNKNSFMLRIRKHGEPARDIEARFNAQSGEYVAAVPGLETGSEYWMTFKWLGSGQWDHDEQARYGHKPRDYRIEVLPPYERMNEFDSALPFVRRVQNVFAGLMEAGENMVYFDPTLSVSRLSDGSNRYDPAIGWSIVAGFPSFGPTSYLRNWSRDTMLSLPGLLATGHVEAFKNIMCTYIRFVKQGLLPNFIGDGTNVNPGSIDSTMLMFWAIGEYLKATGDYAFLQTPISLAFGISGDRKKATILEILEDIMRAHREGIHLVYSDKGERNIDITVDSDGLLKGGNQNTNLTWMDGMVEGFGHIFTPRYGKPGEVNALWKNALSLMADIYGRTGDSSKRENYEARARLAEESFGKYWNEKKGCLYDTIDGDSKEAEMIRPNQMWAVALGLVEGEQAKRIMDKMMDELFTVYGFRTLSRDDPAYKPLRTDGNKEEAYHQGLVWTHLSGIGIQACIRVYGREKTIRLLAEKGYFSGLAKQLRDLHGIAEIFSGDNNLETEYNKTGAYKQAWSIFENLRALSLLFPKLYQKTARSSIEASLAREPVWSDKSARIYFAAPKNEAVTIQAQAPAQIHAGVIHPDGTWTDIRDIKLDEPVQGIGYQGVLPAGNQNAFIAKWPDGTEEGIYPIVRIDRDKEKARRQANVDKWYEGVKLAASPVEAWLDIKVMNSRGIHGWPSTVAARFSSQMKESFSDIAVHITNNNNNGVSVTLVGDQPTDIRLLLSLVVEFKHEVTVTLTSDGEHSPEVLDSLLLLWARLLTSKDILENTSEGPGRVSQLLEEMKSISEKEKRGGRGEGDEKQVRQSREPSRAGEKRQSLEELVAGLPGSFDSLLGRMFVDNEGDPQERALAAWRVGEERDPRALPSLAKAFYDNGTAPVVRIAVIEALGKVKPDDLRSPVADEVNRVIGDALNDEHPQVRAAAIEAFENIDHYRAEAGLEAIRGKGDGSKEKSGGKAPVGGAEPKTSSPLSRADRYRRFDAQEAIAGQLIAGFLSGDDKCFNKLYALYWQAIFNICVKQLNGDSDAASDAVQEIFAKLVKLLRSGSYQDKGRFLPYLRRIAIYTCIDEMRTRKKRNNRVLSLDDEQMTGVARQVIDRAPGTEHNIIQREQLEGCLSGLPDKERESLVLYYIYGFKCKEIGKILQLTKSSVMNYLSWGREKVKKNLEASKVAVRNGVASSSALSPTNSPSGGIDLKADKLNLEVKTVDSQMSDKQIKTKNINASSGVSNLPSAIYHLPSIDFNNFGGFRVEIMGMEEVKDLKTALGISGQEPPLKQYSKLP